MKFHRLIKALRSEVDIYKSSPEEVFGGRETSGYYAERKSFRHGLKKLAFHVISDIPELAEALEQEGGVKPYREQRSEIPDELPQLPESPFGDRRFR